VSELGGHLRPRQVGLSRVKVVRSTL